MQRSEHALSKIALYGAIEWDIDPKVNNLPPKRVKSENYPRSYRFFDTERESWKALNV